MTKSLTHSHHLISVFFSQLIAADLQQVIRDGDVILTYAHSSLIERVLIRAYQDGKRITVLVVDARPHGEGRELCRRLTAAGVVDLHYCLLSSVHFAIQQLRVTKAIIGASACFANGSVLARCGSALIALACQSSLTPCLIFSETYKFVDRILYDSISFNELCPPDDMLRYFGEPSPIADWRHQDHLNVLNLVSFLHWPRSTHRLLLMLSPRLFFFLLGIRCHSS